MKYSDIAPGSFEIHPPPRFVGTRGARCAVVVRWTDPKTLRKHEQQLPYRHDLRNHSPDGFEWGYAGSGPAQLALAMAAFCLEDDAAAAAIYQWLKSEIVAGLPRTGTWQLDVAEVRRLCQLKPVAA